jgi:catechol 2,3-dioxygenase-like lactoylglutathione lyase family enzyme
MNEKQRGVSTGANDTGGEKPPGIFSVHGVRYQVTDVARAAAFYTDHLGFRLEHQQLPAFASVSLGHFMLLLSGPGASDLVRCPAANPSNRADGIEWFCAWRICRRRSAR